MATYGQMVLTTQGLALYQKAQTGVQLNFTRMQIGSGQLPQGQDPTALTALITPIAYFSINSVSSSGNTAYVKGIFENTNINASTYSCELGLFATDPTAGEILYAYANAGALGDTIPPISAGPLSKQYQINVAIGNATSITATIPSDAYIPATDKGADNGVCELDAEGQVPTDRLGNVPPVHAASSGTLGTVEVPSSVAVTTPIVPVRAASAKDVQITTTAQTPVVSFTPLASGNFMVMVSFRVTGSAAVTVNLQTTYTSATGVQTFSHINQSVQPGDWILPVLFINATTATPITVNATVGTANFVDVSASIVGV